MLGGLSSNGRATGDVLAGMATALQGTLLERAIDIALSAQSANAPDTESRALAALLPMMARRSVDDARRAGANSGGGPGGAGAHSGAGECSGRGVGAAGGGRPRHLVRCDPRSGDAYASGRVPRSRRTDADG
jgi:hypothetical protein